MSTANYTISTKYRMDAGPGIITAPEVSASVYNPPPPIIPTIRDVVPAHYFSRKTNGKILPGSVTGRRVAAAIAEHTKLHGAPDASRSILIDISGPAPTASASIKKRGTANRVRKPSTGK
jgi:hypothetical protein